MASTKPIAVKAIELYEASRQVPSGYKTGIWQIDKSGRWEWLMDELPSRVQLTPEQAKAFEDRVEELHSYFSHQSFAIVRRTSPKSFTLTQAADQWTSTSLRQLAAVCEALADNLERFPS